jgi:hypothetical protein
MSDPEKRRKKGPIVGKFKMEDPGIVIGVPDYGMIVDDIFYGIMNKQ